MKKKPPEKERAAAPTTAPTFKLQNQTYPSAKSMSSLKILIGGLLLFGNKERKAFWPLLDAMLRQYVDLRMSGGEHES